MTLAEILGEICRAIKAFEGCHLKAYPDPVWRGVPRGSDPRWGKPWTIGYGETLGVKEGDVWTQEKAESVLKERVAQFLLATLKRCPQLHAESWQRQLACTSLAYNIGVGAFAASSVCRLTTRRTYDAAARSFLLWNKAGGKVLPGLDKRRRIEAFYYMS